MANGIDISGLDELIEFNEKLLLTQDEEKAIVKKSIVPIKRALISTTPKGETGQLSKVKVRVRKLKFGVQGEVKGGAYYDRFQEYGTSFSKKNVGYFDKAIRQSEREAIDISEKELFKKIK